MAALHPGQQPVQVAGLEGGLVAEVLHQQRREQAGKGRVAAQLHLEAQALALVEAHRAGTGDGLAEQLARQTLLVAAVSGLVDRAHQRRQEAVLAVARRHAYVLGHAAAEGVGAFVQPPGLEVEAHQPHRVQAQGLLRGGREGARGLDDRLARLLGRHIADQARQPLPQRCEHALDLGGAHAGLVEVQQRVVLRQAGALRQALGLLARQLQDFAQIGRKAGPVIGRPLRAPGMLATVVGQALGFHQRLRQRVGGAPGAADLAQVGALGVIQRLGRRGVQQAGQRRVGGELVQQAVHLGQGQAACLIALGRHVRGLVPLRDGLQMAEMMQAALTRFEVLVRGGHDSQCSGMKYISATVKQMKRKPFPKAIQPTQGQKGSRSQPATAHSGSPTMGSQLSTQALGPKRFSQASARGLGGSRCRTASTARSAP
mmetsp:Transcript_15092/g.41424  ORF Transcript_15092/g.41424 Transcript_15092/m.41424 type:complete len:429 (-) Transcript_15092:1778-3064(-)